jgi:hypothetical protein
MVRSWLGYLFLLLLLEKSLQAKIKKSFQAKNLCGLCKKHQFVLVPGVKEGCDDGKELVGIFVFVVVSRKKSSSQNKKVFSSQKTYVASAKSISSCWYQA